MELAQLGTFLWHSDTIYRYYPKSIQLLQWRLDAFRIEFC